MPSHDDSGRPLTQRRLITAAALVFAERGIPGASVEAICARAGFTRGAFYSNFTTKTELCIAMLDYALERTRVSAQRLDAVLGRPVTLAEGLAAYHQILSDRMGWVAVEHEFELLALRDPDFRRPYLDFTTEVASGVSEVLQIVLDRAGRASIVDPTRLTEQALAEGQAAWLGAALTGEDDLTAEFVRRVGDVLERGTVAVAAAGGEPAVR